MSNIWACLNESLYPNLLNILGCVNECKPLKIGHENTFESSLPIEVSTIDLKPKQRVLVVSENILKINVREKMPLDQLLQIREFANSFDNFYILPVHLCFQGCKHFVVLLEKDVYLPA